MQYQEQLRPCLIAFHCPCFCYEFSHWLVALISFGCHSLTHSLSIVPTSVWLWLTRYDWFGCNWYTAIKRERVSLVAGFSCGQTLLALSLLVIWNTLEFTFFSTSGCSVRASIRFSASEPTFSSEETCSRRCIAGTAVSPTSTLIKQVSYNSTCTKSTPA